jgi:hypothetical protein
MRIPFDLHSTLARGVPLGLFLPGLALWTWKLLAPNPVPEQVLDLIGFWNWLPFILAKCLHAGGYAFLTLTGGIAAGRRFWPGLVVFMFLHGIGTEIGQTYVPNRHGCVRDVLIDTGGVLASALILRRLHAHDATQPG